MWYFLRQLDISLFLAINHLPHTIITDTFFSFLSAVSYFGFIWIFIGALLIYLDEISNKLELFSFALLSILDYIVVELFFKNLFARVRPEKALPDVIVVWLVNSPSFSFPSGHASLAFAGAYVLTHLHKKWSVFYYILAFLIAFSRIYLGKHYPSDVIVGALVGTGIGYVTIKVSDYIVKLRNKNRNKPVTKGQTKKKK